MNRTGRAAGVTASVVRATVVALLLLLVSGRAGAARADQTGTGRSGAELYGAACAACHGADGRGTTPTLLGFDTPVPDFTDCSFSTVEPDADWMAVVHDGGPARAFDRRMPAFGEALSDADLQRILDHLRGFCRSRGWPRGELNMPRPLVTEKAFPENEAVSTTAVSVTGGGDVATELLYERRLGARTQYEIVVPLVTKEMPGGGWNRGLGDAALALKHVLAHSLEQGYIVSAAGEIVLPTGKESLGLGRGVSVFEPFVAVGRLLPGDAFLQAQAGLELSFEADRVPHEAFWRVAIGKSLTEGRFGRSWSPMVEWLAARELEPGAPLRWDMVPQVQVTLSRRQHIMLNLGARVPLNDRDGRSTRLISYLLWDWFDGGLLDGWR